MSNERIDLTGFEGFTRDELSQHGWHIWPDLIAELKRCYEEIDYLNALTNNLPIEMLVEAENKLRASE